ncbi:translation initiation factor IF-1 [Candidatus Peregrinibacteria bacterium]|jgi:translation initiation factor IF-1|nr:translation initiation factor IF-1 [Candidatus Peregrinibacteria bacterium]
MSDSKSKIEVLGRIVECLPGTHFKVEIADDAYPEGFIVEGHLSGKMRVNYIKIIPGDYVNIELSPYDMGKGRITYRHKKDPRGQITEEEGIAEIPEETTEKTE